MKKSEQIKINNKATREAIRARYGSICAFVRDIGINQRTVQYVIDGKRGMADRHSSARLVLDRLRAEGLLVVEVEA